MASEGAVSGGGDFRLPRAARITRSEEIRALFRRGKRSRTRHLDVFISPSPSAYARLGIVVPKHRQTIVRRNQLKRRLREIGRTVVLPALAAAALPRDVMVRARPEAYAASFAELRAELETLMESVCSGA